MSDLAALGVSVKRGSVDGLTELTFTLPKSSQISASFAREGLADKLRKIFKKEIQTGETLFDEAVSIKTDTVDTTRALLESADVRAIVERVIVNGGEIEIDGATVQMRIANAQAADDEAADMFIRALVGA